MLLKSSPTLFLFALLLIIGLLSCRSIKEPEFQRISNFKILKPGIKESDVHLDLEFKNLNNYKVKLKNVHCSIYVDKNYLGVFEMDTLIHIKGNENFILPLNGKIDMGNLLRNSWKIAFTDDVNIKAEGEGKIGKAGVYIKYPFSYEGNHSLKEMLK